VRDGDHGAGILEQRLLHVLDEVGRQVIRGLIEQQDVAGHRDRDSEFEAPALPDGQVGQRQIQVTGGEETEAEEGIGGVIAICARRVRIRVEERALGTSREVLPQPRHTERRPAPDDTVLWHDVAREHTQQRRLACTVRPGDEPAVALAYVQGWKRQPGTGGVDSETDRVRSEHELRLPGAHVALHRRSSGERRGEPQRLSRPRRRVRMKACDALLRLPDPAHRTVIAGACPESAMPEHGSRLLPRYAVEAERVRRDERFASCQIALPRLVLIQQAPPLGITRSEVTGVPVTVPA
jgi:hypothetical protein